MRTTFRAALSCPANRSHIIRRLLRVSATARHPPWKAIPADGRVPGSGQLSHTRGGVLAGVPRLRGVGARAPPSRCSDAAQARHSGKRAEPLDSRMPGLRNAPPPTAATGFGWMQSEVHIKENTVPPIDLAATVLGGNSRRARRNEE